MGKRSGYNHHLVTLQGMVRCLLCFLLVFSGIADAQQNAPLATMIDAYLRPFVEGKNFLGAVLVAQGDQILFSKAYGDASYSLSVPSRTETRFHIASISKPFTAAAILLLEQRGRLSLDDRVSKYVPDFNRGSEITLRNLLTHTSGIPNITDFPEYETVSRLPQTPLTLVQLFKNKPLKFAPGRKYEYSNSNYNLLALIIEKVSGKTYGEFLREAVFVPAGLQDTGHDGNAADIIPKAAAGYEPRGVADLENAPYIDWSAKTGNGSLYSTTVDLLRFVRAYADGKILPKAVVQRVWTEKTGNNFGCFVRKSQGELAVASNGRSPGFTASLIYFPVRQLAVIVLSNSYSPVSQSPIAEDIAAMAFGKSVRPPEKIVPMPADPAQLRKLEGNYQFGSDFFRPDARVRFTVRGGEPVLDWGNSFQSSLIPVGPGEFMDRQFWARLRFRPDGSGFVYSTSDQDFQVRRAHATR